jgi:quinol monooxygenase YgiN
MIQTFVTFRVLPGRTAEFEAIHRELLEEVCSMPGCIHVDVHRSAGEPTEYMVHGRWESKAAWERAHQTSPNFRRLFARLPVEQHSLSRASFFEPAYSVCGDRSMPVEDSGA